MATTHRIQFVQNDEGKWDIKVESANGNFIVGSTQGYENLADAKTVFRNLEQAIKNRGVEYKDVPKSEVLVKKKKKKEEPSVEEEKKDVPND